MSTNISTKISAIVIDDSDLMRMTVTEALKKVGADVIGEAEDGRAGVDLAISFEPDLIMLDVLMPNMNGLLALQELNARLHEPFVVMMTNVDDDEVVRACMLEGAQDYIIKTMPMTEIMERMDSHIRFLQNRP